MKKYIFPAVCLLIGIFIGGGSVWIISHTSARDDHISKIKYEKLLRFSNIEIGEDRFHCEGDTDRDVASVIGGILSSNDLSVRNKISFQCSKRECVLLVSNCKPWQSDSCGSRLLRFSLNEENDIIPSTFACFDVP